MLKIVTVPADILTKPTKPVEKVDEKIKKIIKDMEKALIAQDDPPGVGLAANQVGLNLSIFIIKPAEKVKIKVFINPKILQTTPYPLPPKQKRRKKIKLEGCLSIPRIWGPVRRAARILLEYQDLAESTDPERSQRIKRRWFQGFEAVIIQHEMDHLNGVVFTQRSLEQKGQIYREENDELIKIEY